MKKILALALLLVLAAFSAGYAFAATKTYQVTGPVLEVSADKLVVQKGKDRWEIARDAGTTVPADLKVGDKVTIQYRMIAASVETKPTGGSKASAKKTSATKGY